MTTLEEFVRDGVVNKYRNGRSIPNRDGFTSINSHGEVICQDQMGRDWEIGMNRLTPTQLRALSAMALWAAGEMEKKQ